MQRRRRHCRLSSGKSTHEFELRQACSRLAAAEEHARTHEARLLREQHYQDMIIETRFGARSRAENAAAILVWADGLLAERKEIQSQLELADAVERPLIEAELRLHDQVLAQKAVERTRASVLQQLRQVEELRREYEEACAVCKKLEDSVQECRAQLKLVEVAKSLIVESEGRVAALERRLHPSLPACGVMYFNAFILVYIYVLYLCQAMAVTTSPRPSPASAEGEQNSTEAQAQRAQVCMHAFVDVVAASDCWFC